MHGTEPQEALESCCRAHVLAGARSPAPRSIGSENRSPEVPAARQGSAVPLFGAQLPQPDHPHGRHRWRPGLEYLKNIAKNSELKYFITVYGCISLSSIDFN